MVSDYLTLVPAEKKDSALLFAWANEEETRKQSFSTGEIPRKVHEEWMADTLLREDRKLYLGFHKEVPVGMLRLDISGTEAKISYSIDKKERHRGYGREIIRAGEKLITEEFPGVKMLCAEVKTGNEASRRIFEELGFEKAQKDAFVCYTKKLP